MKTKLLAIFAALCVLYAPIQLTRFQQVHISMFGWYSDWMSWWSWGIVDMTLTWGLYIVALILLWRLVKAVSPL